MPRVRLERTTSALGVPCSVHLSYRGSLRFYTVQQLDIAPGFHALARIWAISYFTALQALVGPQIASWGLPSLPPPRPPFAALRVLADIGSRQAANAGSQWDNWLDLWVCQVMRGGGGTSRINIFTEGGANERSKSQIGNQRSAIRNIPIFLSILPASFR